MLKIQIEGETEEVMDILRNMAGVQTIVNNVPCWSIPTPKVTEGISRPAKAEGLGNDSTPMAEKCDECPECPDTEPYPIPEEKPFLTANNRKT